jgi:hypothetical protein
MSIARACSRAFAPLIASLLLAGIALPQRGAGARGELRWKLPPRSVAIYERQHEEHRPPEAPASRGPFVRERNPPLLFGAELDDARRVLQLPICDTRDLGRHLAFDLTAYGGTRVTRGEIELQNTLLALDYELRFEAPDDAGRQRAKGRLRPSRGERAEESADERYLTGNQGRLEGEIELARRFDRERGLVVAFDFAMDLRWTPRSRGRDQGTFDLRWREIWTLREVLSADVPADRSRLDALVRECMARAGTWIERKLGPPADPSMWPTPERATSAANFPNGAHAGITLLALLHAGRDRSEPLLTSAFARLSAEEPRDAWAHATRVLALAASAAPREERAGVRGGLGPSSRRLSDADRAPLEASVRTLLAPLDRATQAQPVLWRGAGEGACSELSHLATRALAEAAWCGVALPVSTWEKIARHWLATRSDAGFACSLHHSQATGSATAMALDALLLCRRFLLEDPARQNDAALHDAVDEALRSGWRWMELHYTTRRVPGPLFYAHAQRYHYHWALLSAARADARQDLGQRPLAWETMLHYVGAQTGHGSWANHDDNAFALLCLDAPPRAPETPSSGR